MLLPGILHVRLRGSHELSHASQYKTECTPFVLGTVHRKSRNCILCSFSMHKPFYHPNGGCQTDAVDVSQTRRSASPTQDSLPEWNS